VALAQSGTIEKGLGRGQGVSVCGDHLKFAELRVLKSFLDSELSAANVEQSRLADGGVVLLVAEEIEILEGQKQRQHS
jgi:hypothetical protein